jgi:hypothetical protein
MTTFIYRFQGSCSSHCNYRHWCTLFGGASTTLWVALSLQTSALTHFLRAYLISNHFVYLLNGAPFCLSGCVIGAVKNRFTYLLEIDRNGRVHMWRVPHDECHQLVDDNKDTNSQIRARSGDTLGGCNSCNKQDELCPCVTHHQSRNRYPKDRR